jgi:hypothetical protein
LAFIQLARMVVVVVLVGDVLVVVAVALARRVI